MALREQKPTPRRREDDMSEEALGLIETRGFVAMVEASDAMVKAAREFRSGPGLLPTCHPPAVVASASVRGAPFGSTPFQHDIQRRVGRGDHVSPQERPHRRGGRYSCSHRSFDVRKIPTHHDRDACVPRDIVPNDSNPGSFRHGVSRLDGSDPATGFQKSQRLAWFVLAQWSLIASVTARMLLHVVARAK